MYDMKDDNLLITWFKGWIELLWKATLYWWGAAIIILSGLWLFKKIVDIKEKLGHK